MEPTTEAPQVPTEKLVKIYIKMRDARSALAAEYEAKDKEIAELTKKLAELQPASE